MLKSSSRLRPRITIPSFFDEGNDAGGDNDELDSFIADDEDDFDDSGRTLDKKPTATTDHTQGILSSPESSTD